MSSSTYLRSQFQGYLKLVGNFDASIAAELPDKNKHEYGNCYIISSPGFIQSKYYNRNDILILTHEGWKNVPADLVDIFLNIKPQHNYDIIQANSSHREGDGRDHSAVRDLENHKRGNGEDHSSVAENVKHRNITHGNPHGINCSIIGAEPEGIASSKISQHENDKNHITDNEKNQISQNSEHKTSDGTNHGQVQTNKSHVEGTGMDHSAVRSNSSHRNISSGNPHGTTAGMVGADPAGTANSVMESHETNVNHPDDEAMNRISESKLPRNTNSVLSYKCNMYSPTSVLTDGSYLNFDGDPNNVVRDRTSGETMLHVAPRGSSYINSSGDIWDKTQMPNTWTKRFNSEILVNWMTSSFNTGFVQGDIVLDITNGYYQQLKLTNNMTSLSITFSGQYNRIELLVDNTGDHNINFGSSWNEIFGGIPSEGGVYKILGSVRADGKTKDLTVLK